MRSETTEMRDLHVGVMEGKGAYNKHAKLPAVGAAMAMPFLERAVQRMRLDASEKPVVIADYGSSQGKNSMAPMQLAIRGLRKRIGPNRPISVYHIDQPGPVPLSCRPAKRERAALAGCGRRPAMWNLSRES